jgi:hypothetical protein
MYSKDLLITPEMPPIIDDRFLQFKSDIITGVKRNQSSDPYNEFVLQAQAFFISSKRNHLSAIDKFKNVSIIMGCHHFIDNLLIKHGITGLQIFEHDYKYYQRLCPSIKFSQPGKLEPKKPILMAAPMPGYLNLHPQWNDILTECKEKQIPIHLDGCWLGAATDMQIDLSHESIHSIALSLSKGLGMEWNRIGLRWSNQYDASDGIDILNKFSMIPEAIVRNGLMAINEFDIDYLWDTYGDKHKSICQALFLRPSKIIHAASSVDRSKLFGLRNFFR